MIDNQMTEKVEKNLVKQQQEALIRSLLQLRLPKRQKLMEI